MGRENRGCLPWTFFFPFTNWKLYQWGQIYNTDFSIWSKRNEENKTKKPQVFGLFVLGFSDEAIDSRPQRFFFWISWVKGRRLLNNSVAGPSRTIFQKLQTIGHSHEPKENLISLLLTATHKVFLWVDFKDVSVISLLGPVCYTKHSQISFLVSLISSQQLFISVTHDTHS